MTAFLTPMKAAQVVDCRTFARYAQETVGTPVPRRAEIATLQRKVTEFFALYPQANWAALVATTDWCRAKRKRPAEAWWILKEVRFAWKDGAVPQLDPVVVVDDSVEFHISRALEIETDDRWKRMLIGAVGTENRRKALASWRSR